MRTSSTREGILRALEARGVAVKGNTCQCPDPGHPDAHPSAGIFQGGDGQWRVKCQSCGKRWDYDDLMGTNGQTEKKAESHPPMTREETWAALRRMGTIEKVDVYQDEQGKPLLYEARIVTEKGKTFRPFYPVKDKFRWGEGFKPWPIWNRPAIVEAEMVVVCEGCKASRAVCELGLVATTAPFGAPNGEVAQGKARHSDWEPLRGKRVILWPDNDAPGLRHMQDVAEILDGMHCEIATLDVSRLAAKADAADLGPSERMDLLDTARFHTAIEEYQARNQLIYDGKLRALPTPWPKFADETQAFMPGTVTLFYGMSGSRKTFFLIQLLRLMMEMKIESAYFALEMEMANYIDRALAQETGVSGMVNLKWKQENQAIVRCMEEDHASYIKSFGRMLHFPKKGLVSCQKALEWVEHLPDSTKMIIIDPVSMLTTQKPIWEEHQEMAYQLTRIAQRRHVSIILSNHTTKDGQLMKGGSSLKDHTDATYHWKGNKEGKAPCKGLLGIKEEKPVTNIVSEEKGRYSNANGGSFGFEFLDNLEFEEHGKVVNE